MQMQLIVSVGALSVPQYAQPHQIAQLWPGMPARLAPRAPIHFMATEHLADALPSAYRQVNLVSCPSHGFDGTARM